MSNPSLPRGASLPSLGRSIAGIVCLCVWMGRAPAGAQRVTALHAFTGADGANPAATLLQGSDNNLYGTTPFGGASNAGTVFCEDFAGNLTTLYSFTGGADGANPYGQLAEGNDGNFYGVTYGGGANGTGTVFCVTPLGLLTTLYSFSAVTGNPPVNADGAYPYGGLVTGTDGNLYGTTTQGGVNGYGTLFSITIGGLENTFYAFANGADGANPFAPLVQGMDGAFYGCAYNGGAGSSGTIFRALPDGTFSTTYTFSVRDPATGINADGGLPTAGLTPAPDGSFYGVTPFGGAVAIGTAFHLTSSGLTTLHSFNWPDGANPFGAMAFAPDGNLYGAAYDGGAYGVGTIFQLTPSGGFAVLHNFTLPNNGINSDGANPRGGPIVAVDGFLTGTSALAAAGSDGDVFQYDGVVADKNGPVVTGAKPKYVVVGSGNTQFTVTGKNFLMGGMGILWFGPSTARGGINPNVQVVSAMKGTVVIPAAEFKKVGTAELGLPGPFVPGGFGLQGIKPGYQPVFIIPAKLVVSKASATVANGKTMVSVTIKNTGPNNVKAANISLAQTLKTFASNTNPPLNLGDLAVGNTATTTLIFNKAATSGTTIQVLVMGGDTFNGTKSFWQALRGVKVP